VKKAMAGDFVLPPLLLLRIYNANVPIAHEIYVHIMLFPVALNTTRLTRKPHATEYSPPTIQKPADVVCRK
jgi:hypothetical protein